MGTLDNWCLYSMRFRKITLSKIHNTCFVSWRLYKIKFELTMRFVFQNNDQWTDYRIVIVLIEIQGISNIPVHNKRPSPRHWRHFVVAFLFLLLSTRSLAISLDGSSHRFSPRRKTRRSETSVPISLFTTFCWTSEISVTEGTAAPFSPSYIIHS